MQHIQFNRLRMEDNPMIKKSIASILIILILINSIGCYSYSQIKKEDSEELEVDDEVKITTLDEVVYILVDVEIQGSILKGHRLEYIYWRDYGFDLEEVLIPTEQIKKIEIDKFDPVQTVFLIVLIIAIPVAAMALAFGSADYH